MRPRRKPEPSPSLVALPEATFGVPYPAIVVQFFPDTEMQTHLPCDAIPPGHIPIVSLPMRPDWKDRR